MEKPTSNSESLPRIVRIKEIVQGVLGRAAAAVPRLGEPPRWEAVVEQDDWSGGVPSPDISDESLANIFNNFERLIGPAQQSLLATRHGKPQKVGPPYTPEP